ncbi:anti-sigma factor family protein [Mycobacteroides abscessus]|uniref:anti-sigma factor family protein n=1 Tax=Mycobacteroides abscessus TaxID=36809 RepID=UPI001F32927B|nr:zf-HC2 domain-containing protein [Mycobacteroides abscessus]
MTSKAGRMRWWWRRREEMVELVTAYLEDALDADDRARFETHLHGCEGCAAYLDQLHATVGTLGGIREEHLDPVYRARLLAAFAETAGSW